MRTLIRVLVGVLLPIVGITAFAAWGQQRQQQNYPVQAAPQGIPNDWSHHHLIFSRPSTPAQAALLEKEPRYRMQQAWRSRGALTSEAYMQALDAKAVQLATARTLPTLPPLRWGKPVPRHTPTSPLHRDRSVNMGTGAKVGAGMYPAKFSFNPIGSANCDSAGSPDFVVFNTGLAGSGTQASIIAYDNLYSGCTGTKPLVYWQYNTGGTITTSVALSSDGSQVAFVQGFTLVLLKWKKGSALTTPTSVTTANYRTCSVPCMTAFSLANTDSNSAPFVDYVPDNLYVGDDQGVLYEVSGVFNGAAPALASRVVSSGNKLTSPVHDGGSGAGGGTGLVFVGDSAGHLNSVNSTFTTVVNSVKFANAPGIVDAPILDSAAGEVYAFAASDTGTNAGVFQFPVAFTSSTTPAEKHVGTNSASVPLYAGTFDNAYFSSTSPSTPTGNMYVCGDAGGNPTLYQIPISSGTMNTPVAGPALTGAGTTCSPVTEIFNPNVGAGTDWIYASVQTGGTPTICAGAGCIANFTVTTWQPSTAYALGFELLDSNLNIQRVTTAGTSKSGAHPTWNVTVGGTTTDNTVHWTNEAPLTVAAWQPNFGYSVGDEILDSNFNIEMLTTNNGNKNSGATQPTWATSFGSTTSDGGGHLAWTNEGSGLTVWDAEAGGTSGTVIDNTSTSTGASQIYFSTLSTGTCGGGCAIQTSQATP